MSSFKLVILCSTPLHLLFWIIVSSKSSCEATRVRPDDIDDSSALETTADVQMRRDLFTRNATSVKSIAGSKIPSLVLPRSRSVPRNLGRPPQSARSSTLPRQKTLPNSLGRSNSALAYQYQPQQQLSGRPARSLGRSVPTAAGTLVRQSTLTRATSMRNLAQGGRGRPFTSARARSAQNLLAPTATAAGATQARSLNARTRATAAGFAKRTASSAGRFVRSGSSWVAKKKAWWDAGCRPINEISQICYARFPFNQGLNRAKRYACITQKLGVFWVRKAVNILPFLLDVRLPTGKNAFLWMGGSLATGLVTNAILSLTVGGSAALGKVLPAVGIAVNSYNILRSTKELDGMREELLVKLKATSCTREYSFAGSRINGTVAQATAAFLERATGSFIFSKVQCNTADKRMFRLATCEMKKKQRGRAVAITGLVLSSLSTAGVVASFGSAAPVAVPAAGFALSVVNRIYTDNAGECERIANEPDSQAQDIFLNTMADDDPDAPALHPS